MECLLNIVLTSSVHKAYVFDRKNNLFFPIRDSLHILCYMTSQKKAFCSFTVFTLLRWKAWIAYDISKSRWAQNELYAYAEVWKVYKKQGWGHRERKIREGRGKKEKKWCKGFISHSESSGDNLHFVTWKCRTTGSKLLPVRAQFKFSL